MSYPASLVFAARAVSNPLVTPSHRYTPSTDALIMLWIARLLSFR